MPGSGWARWQTPRDHDRAEAQFTAAQHLASALTDPALAGMVAAVALSSLGIVAQLRGQHDLAAARYQEALTHHRGLGYTIGAIRALMGLGDLARHRGDHLRAIEHYHEAIALAAERGDRSSLVRVLDAIAEVAVAGDADRAARLLGAAEALRRSAGISQVFPLDQAVSARASARARAVLGDLAFTVAVDEGRSLSQENAIAEALAVDATAAALVPDAAARYRLSSREIDVLRGVIERLTDREIAGVLALSPRTVSWHVTSILNKLGVDSRRAAAAIAIRERLT